MGYCTTFSKYSLPMSRLLPGTSLYLLLIAYSIRRWSAPITNEVPSTKRNNRIASNISNIVSGEQRSNSSINTTRFSTLLFFNNSPNSLRKFFISVRVFSSALNFARSSSICFDSILPAESFKEFNTLLSVKSVSAPIPPVSR